MAAIAALLKWKSLPVRVFWIRYRFHRAFVSLISAVFEISLPCASGNIRIGGVSFRQGRGGLPENRSSTILANKAAVKVGNPDSVVAELTGSEVAENKSEPIGVRPVPF